jgi:hypothetical protein
MEIIEGSYYPSICVGELRKITKELSPKIRSPAHTITT